MLRFLRLPSLIAVAIALLVGRRLRKAPTKWHEGPAWERLLRVYDRMAADQFGTCDARLLASRFGDTMVYACGDAENPPVLLLHGLGSSGLIYGDWLVPTLREKFYVVTIDALCDATRSLPRDGDPRNCPQTKGELFEWVTDLRTQLGIHRPASVVGYSYGAFVATQVALEAQERLRETVAKAGEHPELSEPAQVLARHQVDKLVLIAPAATMAPIAAAWIRRIIAYSLGMALFRSLPSVQSWLQNWFFGFMMEGFATAFATWSDDQRELRTAIDGIDPPQVALPPVELDLDVLRGLAARHATLLIMGDRETVIDYQTAVTRANQAGAHVRTYPGAGHMLLVEYPREPVTQEVLQFLVGTHLGPERSEATEPESSEPHQQLP